MRARVIFRHASQYKRDKGGRCRRNNIFGAKPISTEICISMPDKFDLFIGAPSVLFAL